MHVFTRAQREACFKLYQRDWSGKPATYKEFRRTAYVAFGDCVMIPWCNMLIGIEKDGYTHS